MTLAATERAALADLLEEVGPSQPTLCEGWLSGHLLTHLLMRERRPDVILGSLIGPLKAWSKRVQRKSSLKAWSYQVEEFREGPQKLNPIRIAKIDELMNDLEYFVHHEDLRRGVPGWEPRVLDSQTYQDVVALVGSRMIKFGLRGLNYGLTAEFPDKRQIILKNSEPMIKIMGEPAEILMWAMGRRGAARVTFQGDRGIVDTLDKELDAA